MPSCRDKLCLLALTLAALAIAHATTPNFYARRDYPGFFSSVPTVADANGDGIPDLIGLSSGNKIQVLLGNGDGSFRSGPVSVSGMQQSGIDTAVALDVNGDGKVDVVIAGKQAGPGGGTVGIGVCLGNGDGTFQTARLSPGAIGYRPIVAGDFNGDGRPDVAAIGSSGIWLFLGNGDGTFKPPLLTTLANPPTSELIAADINGDGRLDLAMPLGRGFAILLGNGDGTFQPEQETSGAQGVIAVGDVNQDGHPDVVLVSNGSNYANVYLGNGAGGFASPTAVALPAGTQASIAIGDVNGDGIPDLVSNGVAVALGKGGGKFGKPVNYPVTPPAINGPFNVLLADLRNNGHLDIVEQDGTNMLSVMLNTGKGKFADGRFVSVTNGAGLPVAADFNGDGKPDLAVVADTDIVILLGTGNPASPFTTGASIPIPYPYDMHSGDLNGDGIPDLLVETAAPVGSGYAITAYLGRGDGTFTQAGSTNVSAYGYLTLADFNGDGKLDFATAANLLVLGNGDGTFQPPQPILTSPPSTPFDWAATGDLNGDGWPDLVFTDQQSNSMYVLLNNQHGGFSSNIISTASYAPSPYTIVLADLNGDGHLDAVIGLDTGSYDLAIFFGDGRGGFTYQQSLANALLATGPTVVGDVNGDGIPDIVFSEFVGSIAVFVGNGDGTFQTPLYLGPAFGSNGMVLQDLHGQSASAGVPDIVANAFGGVTVLLNTTR